MPPEPDQPTCYRVVVKYDGREFYGWQRLKDKPTVQAALELAVLAAFSERTSVQAAGRTDRGAHAVGQVAGFSLSNCVPAAELVERINEELLPTIRALSAEVVAPTFHVRTDAISKDYEYRIANRAHLDLLRFSADRFLMHMVRNMVRAITKAGEGRYPPEQLAVILAARSRAAAPGSAPASGLYLTRVHYC